MIESNPIDHEIRDWEQLDHEIRDWDSIWENIKSITKFAIGSNSITKFAIRTQFGRISNRSRNSRLGLNLGEYQIDHEICHAKPCCHD